MKNRILSSLLLVSMILVVLTTNLHAQNFDKCGCSAVLSKDVIITHKQYSMQHAAFNLIDNESFTKLKQQSSTSFGFTIPKFIDIFNTSSSYSDFEQKRKEFQINSTNQNVFDDQSTIQYRSSPVQFNAWKECMDRCLAPTDAEGLFARVWKEDNSKIIVFVHYKGSDNLPKTRTLNFNGSDSISSIQVNGLRNGEAKIRRNSDLTITFNRGGKQTAIIISETGGNRILEYSSIWKNSVPTEKIVSVTGSYQINSSEPLTQDCQFVDTENMSEIRCQTGDACWGKYKKSLNKVKFTALSNNEVYTKIDLYCWGVSHAYLNNLKTLCETKPMDGWCTTYQNELVNKDVQNAGACGWMLDGGTFYKPEAGDPKPSISADKKNAEMTFYTTSAPTRWKVCAQKAVVTSINSPITDIQITGQQISIKSPSTVGQVDFSLQTRGRITCSLGNDRQDAGIILIYKDEKQTPAVYEYLISN